jgi:RimJ/RimL family protein N-acetyltransferase
MHVFLETENLLLRRFTEADLDNLVELDGDPEVMRYLTGGPATPREEIAGDILPAWLRYYERYEGFGFWAAIEKATGEFIGWFHFRPPSGSPEDEVELGYRLRRAAWGKGYGTEASRALIRKGFTEFGVRRVFASTAAENIGSRRVMEKSGLKFLRTYRMVFPGFFNDEEQEDVEYALLKEDWEREQAAVPEPS